MKLKRPHFEKLKSLTNKQKKLILAGIALLLLILAASYTVFIAPLLQKEQWIYKEETVERGTLKVGVTESGSLEYNTKSIDYDLDLDVSDDDEDDSEDDDDDTVQKYLKIEEIYAASGQRVTEGEELLKFTEDSVVAVRALLQNAVVEAKADYAEAESTYELSLLEAQTDYDTQKISASYAASIRNTSGTTVANNVASLQVQMEQKKANTASLQEKLAEAQENYKDALETYEAAREGYEDAGMDNTVNFMVIQSGYLSAKSKYQQAKSALTQAENAVADNESAIVDLENQLAAARAKQNIDRLDTEETYQEAVITGQNAQTTYNATVEDLKETLQEAEETKEKREEQLQAFEDFVGSDGIPKEIQYENTPNEEQIKVKITTEKDKDIREELFYALAKANCPILELTSSSMSLEDVFLELTDDSGKAARKLKKAEKEQLKQKECEKECEPEADKTAVGETSEEKSTDAAESAAETKQEEGDAQ